jgi:hypothetical protein
MSASVCDAIKKICALMRINTAFLDKITDLGVIAGGAITYALNNFVPIESVGDIDIFVLAGDEDKFKIIIKLLINYYSSYIINNFCEKYIIKDVCNIINKYIGNEIKHSIFKNVTNKSILNMKWKNINIQLILSSFTTINDLLNNFDIDINKCGYYKKKITTISDARNAFDTKIASCLKKEMRFDRLKKIYNKGFMLKNNCISKIYEKNVLEIMGINDPLSYTYTSITTGYLDEKETNLTHQLICHGYNSRNGFVFGNRVHNTFFSQTVAVNIFVKSKHTQVGKRFYKNTKSMNEQYDYLNCELNENLFDVLKSTHNIQMKNGNISFLWNIFEDNFSYNNIKLDHWYLVSITMRTWIAKDKKVIIFPIISNIHELNNEPSITFTTI